MFCAFNLELLFCLRNTVDFFAAGVADFFAGACEAFFDVVASGDVVAGVAFFFDVVAVEVKSFRTNFCGFT